MFKKISDIFTKRVLLQRGWKVRDKVEGKDVDIGTFLIPPRFRDSFDIEQIKEKPKEFDIILREKKEMIPPCAQEKDVSLIGFLNSVEVVSFPMYEKPVYIRYFRRRWRDQERKQDFYNTYEFHPKGIKATHELVNFLKETDRRILNAFFYDWKSIRHIAKKDFYMV